MRAVSDRFQETLLRPHQVVSKVEVVDAKGQLQAILQPVGGRVSVDETARIRRECSVSFAASTSAELKDLTDLVGRRTYNELRIFRGIRFDDGTEELPVLGVFPIADHEVSDTGRDLVVDVRGYDRAWRVQRAKWSDAWTLNGTYELSSAIRLILWARAPWLPVNFDPTHLNFTNAVIDVGDDPWEKCTSLAHLAGYELYVTATGIARMRHRKSYLSGHVVRYAEDGLLEDIRLAEDAEHQWNQVVVSGEMAGAAPVRGFAEDNDPQSPTYVRGPMGEVPMFHQSRKIVSTSVAQQAADMLLDWATGWQETVTFTGVPHPALDEFDRLHIVRERMGLNGIFNLEQFDVPLEAEGKMTGSARRRRIG